MKDLWPIFAVIVTLSAIKALFGDIASLWVGSVALAFIVGVLWGSGSEIARRALRDAGEKS